MSMDLNRFLWRGALAALAVTAGVSASAQGQEWPRFRGVNGVGVSGADIPAKWTEKSFVWKTDLPGVGHGSPIVWGDRVFLLCGDEETAARLPVCIDAKSGALIWKKEFKALKHRHHKFNSVASSTPVADAGRVVFSWGTKEKLTLIAFDHGGTKLWESDLGPVQGGHGFGASPVIHGDLVVINNDQDGESSLIAVNKATGKLVWKLPRDSERLSYSCPAAFAQPGGDEALVFTNWRHGITALDPANGKVIWEKSVFNQEKKERAIGSPVIAGDLLIGTCGFVQNPKHVVALRPGDGDAEEVWRIEEAVPHIPTPLVVGQRVFLWEDKGTVTCADHSTGKVVWRERVSSASFSSPVCANGRIFSVDRNGLVTVIAAADEFRKLAENDLGETCHATPAISGGTMFVRTYGKLMAIR